MKFALCSYRVCGPAMAAGAKGDERREAYSQPRVLLVVVVLQQTGGAGRRRVGFGWADWGWVLKDGWEFIRGG